MKPKCANKKCSNDAFVNVGGKWYCGECVVRWNDKQNKRLQEEMEWN